MESEKKTKNNNTEIKPHSCYWLNQKGEPCPWNSISPDKNYCKRHSIYEGIFEPADIKSLTKCSGCKNYWKPKSNSSNKTCSPCIDRAKTNRTKEKEEEKQNPSKKCLRCVEINKTNPTEPNENSDYCGKHQTWGKWKKLTEEGKQICSNWIRGCFNETIDDFKRCENCRTKSQEKENKLNKEKKNKAIEFNQSTNTNNQHMCLICNKMDTENNFINQKCLNCYESYRKAELNRKNKKIAIKIKL